MGEAIYKVAQSYLRLEAKGEILRIQKEMAHLAKETTRYWQQLESADGRQGVALNVAQQHEREVELTSERMIWKRSWSAPASRSWPVWNRSSA